MKLNSFLLLVVTILTLPAITSANPELLAQQNQLISQAKDKKLADAPYWRALLHYKKKPFWRKSKFSSDIVTSAFFLSTNGLDNPSAELEATIRGMFQPIAEQPDTHPQCRFIARYQWLKQELDWSFASPPIAKCQAFKQWANQEKVESISLFFATGYLQNPASFYGHILLRFNRPDNIGISNLLDTSLDYGAIIPDNINPAIYIAKGLFGGFDAGFSQGNFYAQNHNYGEVQLRDLWEYELSLNDHQIEQILTHAWELFTNKFVYYFLDENCAYAMAELLELVIKKPLVTHSLPWTIPVYVFDNLSKSKIEGEPLVKAIRRHPSRRNRLIEKFRTLDNKSKSIVKSYAKQTLVLDDTSFQSLSTEQKYKIIDTLLDYYQYLLVYDPESSLLNKKKQELLLARISMPAHTVEWPQHRKIPPHDGQNPGMVALEYTANDATGDQAILRFRPAYFDFLSLNVGRPPFASLTMGDVSIARTEDDIYLKNVDIIKVESLNPSATGLPGDKDLAWKLEFGYEVNDLSCTSCGVANLDGGFGKAFQISDNTVIYGMMNGRLQESYNGSGHLAVSPQLGVVTTLFGRLKTQIAISERQYIDGEKKHNTIINWETRLNSHKAWDLRIHYAKNIEDELGFSARYHM